jgi:hypothetical protein
MVKQGHLFELPALQLCNQISTASQELEICKSNSLFALVARTVKGRTFREYLLISRVVGATCGRNGVNGIWPFRDMQKSDSDIWITVRNLYIANIEPLAKKLVKLAFKFLKVKFTCDNPDYLERLIFISFFDTVDYIPTVGILKNCDRLCGLGVILSVSFELLFIVPQLTFTWHGLSALDQFIQNLS